MAKHEVLSAQRLEQLWADHLKGEFESKDVEVTLATMVEDASVNHVPVNTGGKGKGALRRFYRDDFIPSWPDDLEILPVNRVIGDAQLVDELRLSFTHIKPMPWFLPECSPDLAKSRRRRCRRRSISWRQARLRAHLLGPRERLA